MIAHESLLEELRILLEKDPQQVAAHIRLWLAEEDSE